MLIEAEKRERERGVLLWLVGLNPEVLSVIQQSGLGKVLGRERMHFNLELAVLKYLAAPANEVRSDIGLRFVVADVCVVVMVGKSFEKKKHRGDDQDQSIIERLSEAYSTRHKAV